jgi:hypothetical protein
MVGDPISGGDVAAALSGADPARFTLLHGVADDVVPVTASRDFARALEAHGWPVESVELAADHGSIAGATYDAVADRYTAAADPDTTAVAAGVAARIAALSSR